MSDQMIFERYELKYLLTERQKELVLRAMEPYMELDPYGHATIRNIYFDTDNFRLARHSMEKPAYKEKLRVRSYSRAASDDTVFVELKKKYQSIVYKRRLPMTERQASEWLCGLADCPCQTQIAKEVAYFLEYYQTLRPVVFLSYEREAFCTRNGDDFRVTFDGNILARSTGLSLGEDIWGTPLLGEGMTLMEIKTSGGIPLWMSQILTGQRLFKTSFSKYGTAYGKMIYYTYNKEGGRMYA